ncbi:MAG: sterol desaturase family protein [Candidatus Bathyarchaeota archaeon]|nr:MAG: sterol desaturase family protein [Candidatus Bathyarchaeota archaeon]
MIVIIVFVFMEGVAWFLHKYVMHGIGWFLHEDHHRATKGRFEKNDAFGLFFAVVSFLLILTGILSGFDAKLAFGFGIMLYGVGYFMVHDVFFHKRIKISFRPKYRYIRRILNAHATHHQVSTSKSGICFGFLYANKKYSV